jgi:hypothetical protein
VTEGKAIVTRRLAMTDMAAKVTVDTWMREAGPAEAKLAEYHGAADKQGLQGDPLRNGVVQMIALAKKKRSKGHRWHLGRWWSASSASSSEI